MNYLAQLKFEAWLLSRENRARVAHLPNPQIFLLGE